MQYSWGIEEPGLEPLSVDAIFIVFRTSMVADDLLVISETSSAFSTAAVCICLSRNGIDSL